MRVHPEFLATAEAAAEAADQGHLEGTLRGHRRFERYLARNGTLDPEVLPPRLEGRAEEALPRAPRRAREELEILAGRREGAELLGRLHEGLRGHDPAHGGTAGAVVRRARRQQMVHSACRGRGDRPRDRAARPQLPGRRLRGRDRSSPSAASGFLRRRAEAVCESRRPKGIPAFRTPTGYDVRRRQ